jgi:hypothetical protein
MIVIDDLGRPISKLLQSEPFKSWQVERWIDDDLGKRVIEYAFAGRGLEVRCDAKDEIASIFLSSSDGWNDSLFDIPFSLTRAEVVSRLGTPEKSGKQHRDPILGDMGAWDRFRVPQGVIHIQYRFDGPGISKITLMRSDVVP